MPVRCPSCSSAIPHRPHAVDICPACHSVLDATAAGRHRVLLHISLIISGGVIIWLLAASGLAQGTGPTLVIAVGMIAGFLGLSHAIDVFCARAFPPVAIRDEAHRRHLLTMLHVARIPPLVVHAVRERLEAMGGSEAASQPMTSSIKGWRP